jgi:hypothetical protein
LVVILSGARAGPQHLNGIEHAFYPSPTTLLYALLRPTSNERPGRALIWAMVVAASGSRLGAFSSSLPTFDDQPVLSLAKHLPLQDGAHAPAPLG